MAYDFVKISALPPAIAPLGGAEDVPVVQAGVTYRFPSRAWVLPTDPLITFAGFQGNIPGSRRLVGGAGVTINLTADEVVLSASSAGSIVVLDQTVAASLSGTEQDWDPIGWDMGAGKSRFDVTPLTTPGVIGGLEASGAVEGQVIGLMNDSGANNIRLLHQSGSSAAANRISCPGGANFSLVPYQGVLLIYRGASLGWRFFS